MIRSILKWMGHLLTVLLVIAIGFAVFTMFQSKRNPGHIPSIMGYQPMSVLTGSMRPLLEPGDMIFVKKGSPETIQVGDVITYQVDSKTLVTHRVIEIIPDNGRLSFRTKGDANNVEDHMIIPQDHVLGILAFSIPKGGYIANFARSGKGFVLFIVLPIVLLIAIELKTIWREVDKEKKDKSEPKDLMEV